MSTENGVLFQHFYYPTPDLPAERSWWKQTTAQLAELGRIGIWGVWHPVPSKGGSGRVSMGYDPYDLYDLGCKDQRGTVPTHFGTRDDYLAYVATAHANGLRVIADVVLNHCGGADQAQTNPTMERLGWDDIGDDSKVPPDHFPPGYDPRRDNLRSWTGFYPRGVSGIKGTGRFPRDARHFHPNPLHPDHSEPYHKPYFGSDYCQEAEDSYVGLSFIDWAAWFLDQSGVDGFRLDAVKHVEPGYLRLFAARARAKRPNLYLVGEFWDTNPPLLADFQRVTQRQMGLFDFGLYYALRDLTEKPGFDLRELLTRRFADRERAVTFVSNHDVDRDPVIIDRKKRALPYALMMALSGQPSVFYLDYFQALDPELPALIRRLIPLHNRFATGSERVVLAEPRQLVIERAGGLLAQFWTGSRPPEPAPGVLRGRTPSVTGPGFTYYCPLTPSLARAGVSPSLARAGVFSPSLARHPEGTRVSAAMPTTQIFEFDDDLDTGCLGSTVRRVSVRAEAGTTLVAQLRGTYGAGNVLLELRDVSGRGIAATGLPRGATAQLDAKIPARGWYEILLTAPGNPTTARLHVTYTAPR